jgi:hypothetical protein
MQVKIKKLLSGADDGGNEDWIAHYAHDDGTVDLLVLDGATSVAERNYIGAGHGDVVWFVESFAQALGATISPDATQQQCVLRALNEVAQEFRRETEGMDVPLYAWPIAAMTWIRARKQEGDVRRLEIYALGDCKTLLHYPGGATIDLDPYVNPQEAVLQNEIASLAQAGIDDTAARREKLLPMLRARREFQNATSAPFALCLDPQGPLNARTSTVELRSDALVLAMTDGFYRLVDTYGLYTNEQLAIACAERSLEELMQELRGYEAARQQEPSVTVKSADDASVLACFLSVGPTAQLSSRAACA